MKINQTTQIERILIKHTSSKLGVHGALEVTLDWLGGKSGYQRADYVEIKNNGEITCYEIKVNSHDIVSENIISYFGDRNYLVVPDSLKDRIVFELKQTTDTRLNKTLHGLRWHGVGVISVNLETGELSVISKCKHKTVDLAQQVAILKACFRSASRDFLKLKLKN